MRLEKNMTGVVTQIVEDGDFVEVTFAERYRARLRQTFRVRRTHPVARVTLGAERYFMTGWRNGSIVTLE